MFVFTRRFLLLLCVICSNSASTVKFAAILYRHGDTTPVAPYYNDPYGDESLWPVKFGELTSFGILKHYRLGKWLKSRYEHLLSEQYDPKEIYIRSTDTSETISSVLANLAGMFPGQGKSIWDKDLLLPTFPIHIVPEESDEILGQKKSCPTYEESLDILKNSKSYRDELLKYLSEHTGTVVENYEDIERIYSTLKIEIEHNYSLPCWTRSVFPFGMEKPACHSFRVPTLERDLARIKAGPLLKNIVHHMTEAAQSKTMRKLSIYSGHDNNVANFLNALNIFDEHCPPFTATVLVELFKECEELPSLLSMKSDQGTHIAPRMFVRILYKNSTEIVEPLVLPIPHCGEVCPLDTFISLYKFLIDVDWETDCAILTKFMILSFLFIFFLVIAIWSCFFYYITRSKTLNYEQDNNDNDYY